MEAKNKAFTFTTLVDDDRELVQSRQRKRKRMGLPFKNISADTRAELKKLQCDEIRYTWKGENSCLSKQDIVILKNGEFGTVSKLFSNGNFIISKQKAIYNLKDISMNISIIYDYEQDLMDRNRYWCEDQAVEVFSQSTQTWCSGKIMKVFHLKTKDPLDVHPEKWYSLSYTIDGKTKYKQLQWHSADLRSVLTIEKTRECEDRELSEISYSKSSFSSDLQHTPMGGSSSSILFKNSIFE